ncbi:GDYXXLXY domain-containing protein [Ohtaekwangia kribbensis]|jgi:uncharacterized membrane-anchored protein|uniref:GDYXXLXY domain-containing protein n=1 Tax=Ohtaekwangia kribbensis TaxID=688913 RepID=A0ABW3K637_9BACT
MKKIILPLFIVMCLVQWYVPAKMIVDQEAVLSEGKVYKFKTAPVDPADPFRGKYIVLSFAENHFKVKDYNEWLNVHDIYVSLTDSAGFARIRNVSVTEPQDEDYVKARVDFVSTYEPYAVWIEYPFDRFYLEESKASEAEKIYWESQRNDSTQIAYAVVSVRNGEAALTDVRINDRSIVDIVAEINQEQSSD